MSSDNVGAAHRTTADRRTPWLGIAMVTAGILSGVAVYLVDNNPSSPRSAENTEAAQPTR